MQWPVPHDLVIMIAALSLASEKQHAMKPRYSRLFHYDENIAENGL
jgi:hypothetical protein